MHSVAIWRVLAVWLLTLCVCFGPGSFGVSVALAAEHACGGACPCAGAGVAAHASDHEELGANDPCPDEPCDHDCASDCPSCACSLGTAMAVLPLPLAAQATHAWSMPPVFTFLEAPACGSRTRVFRPPRVRD